MKLCGLPPLLHIQNPAHLNRLPARQPHRQRLATARRYCLPRAAATAAPAARPPQQPRRQRRQQPNCQHGRFSALRAHQRQRGLQPDRCRHTLWLQPLVLWPPVQCEAQLGEARKWVTTRQPPAAAAALCIHGHVPTPPWRHAAGTAPSELASRAQHSSTASPCAYWSCCRQRC